MEISQYLESSKYWYYRAFSTFWRLRPQCILTNLLETVHCTYCNYNHIVQPHSHRSILRQGAHTRIHKANRTSDLNQCVIQYMPARSHLPVRLHSLPRRRSKIPMPFVINTWAAFRCVCEPFEFHCDSLYRMYFLSVLGVRTCFGAARYLIFF